MNWYKTAKNEFDLNTEINGLWDSLLHAEMDRCGIHFNTENNDSISEIKNIKLDYEEDKEEFRIKAQAFSAGGDWECPNVYFRGQLESRYNSSGKYMLDKKFIYIPKENWNIKKKDGEFYATNNSDEECSDTRKIPWDLLKKEVVKRMKEEKRAIEKGQSGGVYFQESGLIRDLDMKVEPFGV